MVTYALKIIDTARDATLRVLKREVEDAVRAGEGEADIGPLNEAIFALEEADPETVVVE